MSGRTSDALYPLYVHAKTYTHIPYTKGCWDRGKRSCFFKVLSSSWTTDGQPKTVKETLLDFALLSML